MHVAGTVVVVTSLVEAVLSLVEVVISLVEVVVLIVVLLPVVVGEAVVELLRSLEVVVQVVEVPSYGCENVVVPSTDVVQLVDAPVHDPVVDQLVRPLLVVVDAELEAIAFHPCQFPSSVSAGEVG